ncbi:MAG: hypothetical protein L3K26_14475 [Candidatus Hydrogenedentes bacterium]|nr:hypothetical protein [Candidatus Hydrogenedentota bacterium]
MMAVIDEAKYQRYRAEKTTRSPAATLYHELVLPVLLFGSMGAITWAIRGTSGWNGVDGTIVPGLTWGLLWYYLCWRKGIDARGVVLWLGLGIAIGGELGYGPYVSWIRDIFQVADGTISIAPWHGYLWFTICGIGWAAPGGIALGWALSKRSSALDWTLRIILYAVVIALAWWPVVNLVSKFFVSLCPSLLYPHYGTGIYQGVLDENQVRTVYTNSQNFAFLLWWIVALAVAAIRRDRATLIVGAILGSGFGVGFVLSALWCLGYSYAPGYVDWWKVWELQAGFNLGLLCVVALLWAIRQVDAAHDEQGNPLGRADCKIAPMPDAERRRSISSVPILCAVLIFAFLEGFFWTGAFLAALYAVTLCFASFSATPDTAIEARARAALSFTVFLLLFVLLRGATTNAGVVLGLYDIGATDQYAWPTPRIFLFVPIVLVLVAWLLHHLWKNVQPSSETLASPSDASLIGVRVADLMTLTGVVGAITIWPAKIGVLYAIFIAIAFFAFNRINRAFDQGDA